MIFLFVLDTSLILFLRIFFLYLLTFLKIYLQLKTKNGYPIKVKNKFIAILDKITSSPDNLSNQKILNMLN